MTMITHGCCSTQMRRRRRTSWKGNDQLLRPLLHLPMLGASCCRRLISCLLASSLRSSPSRVPPPSIVNGSASLSGVFDELIKRSVSADHRRPTEWAAAHSWHLARGWPSDRRRCRRRPTFASTMCRWVRRARRRAAANSRAPSRPSDSGAVPAGVRSRNAKKRRNMRFNEASRSQAEGALKSLSYHSPDLWLT